MSRRPVLVALLIAVAAGVGLAIYAKRRAADGPPFTARHVEDFPALVADDAGTLWLATIQRPVPERFVQIDRVVDGERVKAAELALHGLTGIGPPDIAPLESGCVVTFAVEIEDRWRIAVAFVDESGADVRLIEADGRVNRDPAVACNGERAWVVWQSDATLPRGIYATWVDRNGQGALERLSSADHASGNPDVTRFPEEGGELKDRLLAAWDSLRKENVDLYGAAFDDDTWTPEARLTQDARIERHVSLAGRTLAWEAQSFKKHLVNGTHERLVFVAAIDGIVPHRDGAVLLGGALRRARESVERVVSTERRMLRPWLGTDPSGRLWLTARESPLKAKHGWRTLVWMAGETHWSRAQTLFEHQGRWRPVPIAWDADGGAVAAVQRDDLPDGWLKDDGVHAGWRSQVDLVPVAEPDVEEDGEEEQGAAVTGAFEPPATEFQLADHMRALSADLPRQDVVHLGRRLKLYWGDLHEHTDMSVCQRARNAPVPDLWANQRDIEKLDFTAITDHGFNMDAAQWQYAGEQVRAHHDADRFVTFLGEEWTSDVKPDGKLTGPGRYGHRNLIFLDPYHPRFYDAHDGDVTPAQIWKEFGDADVLTIPHQLADTGNVPTDWNFHDDRQQPVAEIFQQRGSYEALGAPLQAKKSQDVKGNFLQDAWARGITIGVIASADHGGGRGKVGVWADTLSRESLFEAIRARRTFGTTGPKIAVWLGTDTAKMGDVVERLGDGVIPFSIQVVAGAPIEKVVLLRNNEVVETFEAGDREFKAIWVDQAVPDAPRLWYYVRVHRKDGHLAWSSPIWFDRPEAR